MRTRFLILIAGVSLLLSTNMKVHASGIAFTNVTVKVNVMSAPCNINNGKPIEVDFGTNLRATLIDGEHYITPVNYSIDCNNSLSPALKMKIIGESASFDTTALKVAEKDNMGINLLNGNVKFPINTWLSFNKNTPPVLTAVPITAARSKLTPGSFSAVATMRLEYE